MDYQASTSSSKITKITIAKKLVSFLSICLFFCPTLFEQGYAQTTPNPLTAEITVYATVLVGTWVRPDTPPTPPSPGPINMSEVNDVAIFRGTAYPGSTVFLLQNGFIVAEMPTNQNGVFDIRLRSVTPGTYSFGLKAEDGNHLTSKLVTFTVVIAQGIATTIDGIFLPPTITSDNSEVKKGDKITFMGTTAPDAEIRLSLLSTLSHVEMLKKVKANASGSWMYAADSSELAFGEHEAKVRAVLEDNLSPYSDPLSFVVGSTTKARNKGGFLLGFRKKCDLNDDSRVNLIDFSIMAFWYKRLGFPVKVDLNTDNRINLTDLSILAYCWTG